MANKPNGYKIIVPYVSVWDVGVEVETKALVNIKTGEVTDIEPVNVHGLEICEREYIIMNDEQVDVFTDEHGYDYWVDLSGNEELYKKLKNDIKNYVASSFVEYHQNMPQSFYNDILTDVMECSAYDEGYYSQSDISLAFQRVIFEKFREV